MELKRLCCVVVLTIVVSGCTSKQQPQFQGSVGQWDDEVSDACKVVAITLVAEALKQAEFPPSDEQIERALVDVYGQCLIRNGRTI